MDAPASAGLFQPRCGYRHPGSRWTYSAGNGSRTANSLSFEAAFDGLVAGIFKDHLPHLVCEFLPVANVITGARIGKRFNALFFQNFENLQRAGPGRFWL
jgi:hypothetical protein